MKNGNTKEGLVVCKQSISIILQVQQNRQFEQRKQTKEKSKQIWHTYYPYTQVLKIHGDREFYPYFLFQIWKLLFAHAIF